MLQLPLRYLHLFIGSILATSHYLVHFLLLNCHCHPQHLHHSYWNSHLVDEDATIYDLGINFNNHLLASLNQGYFSINYGIVEDLTLS